MPEFQCDICKLKYRDEAAAKQCHAWCSAHDSCNFAIARQAINKGKVARGKLDDKRFKH
ncbi:MAG: hypothetical protein AAB729_02725 [Patescibacteria group bacterium]